MKYLCSKAALPNLIIWLIILVPTYILKYQSTVTVGILTPIYLFLEGISWFLLAILLTAGMHFCIDKFTKEKDSLIIKIAKFIIYVTVASLIFQVVLWPFLDYLYITFNSKKLLEAGKLITAIYNWFVWIVWYSTISFLALYSSMKKAEIKNVELLANLKESQLNTLKGQINPHFMFNSLNNIRGLMLEDVERARNMLTALSETLRYSLTKNDANAIALIEELEMVENYIEISKIQFEERLRFEKDIDQATLQTQIPPMIIQMLIENAIKHGISNLKEGGNVSLTTCFSENNLLIKVTNTGKLNPAKSSTQLGLNNIKQRLNLLYGKTATFNLSEKENQVIATIKIPLS